jgi:hypothetical protein
MFLNEVIAVRINIREKKMVKRIVRKDKNKYDSAAHFHRCALIKLMREEKKRLKL